MRNLVFILVPVIFGLLAASQIGPTYHESTIGWTNYDDFGWMTDNTSLLIGADQILYRTQDFGFTWTDLSSQLDGSNIYSPAHIQWNWYDSDVAFVMSTDVNVSWYSRDNAITWKRVSTGRHLINFDWHPTQPLWVLAMDLDDGVWATQDLESWTQVAQFSFYSTWGDAGVEDVPTSRIYLTPYEISGDANDIYRFVYTDDWGLTNFTIQENGINFVFSTKTVFAMVDLPATSTELLVSTDYGHPHKEFRTAQFAENHNNAHTYTVIDDYHDTVYLALTHDSRDAYGTLYTSDTSRTRYTVSLEYIASYYGTFAVNSLWYFHGVAVANVLSDPSAGWGSKQRTQMTRDNGATWFSLSPPRYDSNGNPITCPPGPCSLHLATWTLQSSRYGTIVCDGNVGPLLAADNSQLNTYLSRDAGQTWIELRKGASVISFADHAGVIILADAENPTDTLYYTLNFGQTMQSMTISEPIDVDYILGMRNATPAFIVFGEHSADQQSITVGIDFSNAFKRDCDNSDYETWGADGDTTDSCLLGQNVTYLRRKASSLCFDRMYNESDTKQITFCTCTDADWECDFEYTRDSTGNCAPTANAPDPQIPPHYCPENENYTITRGYQKVAGDHCVDGPDQYWPIVKQCPPAESHVGKKGWIAAAVLVPLVLIVLAIAITAMGSERVREALPFLKVLPSFKAGYSAVWNGSEGNTSLVDIDEEEQREEEEDEEDDKEFSIQADEIEDGQIENLNSHDVPKVVSPSQQRKTESLISLEEEKEEEDDDFNPRK